MQTKLLLGKPLAAKIEAELAVRVSEVKAKTGRAPVLATILVGDDPSSVTYVRMKGNACRRVGLEQRKIELPESTTTDELVALIESLNADKDVCGILLQHPVPSGIDERKCFDTIALDKDVDGVNTAGFGAMAMGLSAYGSATPMAIMTILDRYGVEIEGKEAVVIGRSAILGKPVAMMLLSKNATVTICHSRTKNLAQIVKRADIVVAAVGKPKFVQADWIKEGAVVVDAGYNESNVGDVDLEHVAPKTSAYTPVPGGVGPMTIAMLMSQAVSSAEKHCK